MKWRLYPAQPWQDSHNWPRYNFNDTYYDQPRCLTKLYRTNQQAVDHWTHQTL